MVEPEIINRIKGSTDGGKETPLLFETPKQQEAALITLDVIKEFERLPRSSDLKSPEVQEKIVEQVTEIIRPAQAEFEGFSETVNVKEVVAKTVDLRNELSIDIPRIVIVPEGEVTCGYSDFDIDTSNIQLQPVENEILIQHLRNSARYKLVSGNGIVKEERLEDYLVRGLIDFDDISYDDHSNLLYRLSGQVVRHLQSYLKNEDEVLNVLQYHQQTLVNLIHAQMQDHYEEKATAYEVHVSKGFETLKSNTYSARADEDARNFRVPVDERQMIKGMLF